MSYVAQYADMYLLGQDNGLRNRLVPDLIQKANYFLSVQPPPSEPTLALARAIARGSVEPFLIPFARQISVNGSALAAAVTAQGVVDQSLISDQIVDSVVSAVWATIAGG